MASEPSTPEALTLESLRRAALEAGQGGEVLLPADAVLEFLSHGFEQTRLCGRVWLDPKDWIRVLDKRDRLTALLRQVLKHGLTPSMRLQIEKEVGP